MIPYDAPMIRAIIRKLPDQQFARVRPSDFHRWPAEAITPTPAILELIANERVRRALITQGEQA